MHILMHTCTPSDFSGRQAAMEGVRDGLQSGVDIVSGRTGLTVPGVSGHRRV